MILSGFDINRFFALIVSDLKIAAGGDSKPILGSLNLKFGLKSSLPNTLKKHLTG